MKIAVIGALADGGSHLVLDLITDGAPYEVIAFLDDNPALWGTSLCGIPVLGPSADASRAVDVGAEGAVVFLGNPREPESALAVSYSPLDCSFRSSFIRGRTSPRRQRSAGARLSAPWRR